MVTLPADAPKIVGSYPLAAYASHDECVHLAPEDRLEYRFEATVPVKFDIRYREGNAIVMPVVRDQTRADAGIYAFPLTGALCLVWEAGPAGAVLDYRVRVLAPAP